MTEIEFYQKIGQKIKEFRKAAKLTQDDVAVKAEIYRTDLSAFESRGERIKSADIIRRIVEATGHTMADVFVEPAQKKTAFTSSSPSLCPSSKRARPTAISITP